MKKADEDMAQVKRLKERMDRIKHKIMVMSGKGGVGKTTVTVNLALTLALKGYEVGIMVQISMVRMFQRCLGSRMNIPRYQRGV